MSSSRVSLEDRREQLIEATIGAMREVGVQSITLRGIAKRAGAPLAAVHYCFESKEALIQAAVVRWLQEMVGYATSIPTTVGFSAAVHSFAELYWAELERNPEDVLAQIELVLWAARQGEDEHLRGLIYKGYEDELASIFAKALEGERPGQEFRSRDFVRLMLSIFDGASLQYILQPDLEVHKRNFFFLVGGAVAGVLDTKSTE